MRISAAKAPCVYELGLLESIGAARGGDGLEHEVSKRWAASLFFFVAITELPKPVESLDRLSTVVGSKTIGKVVLVVGRAAPSRPCLAGAPETVRTGLRTSP